MEVLQVAAQMVIPVIVTLSGAWVMFARNQAVIMSELKQIREIMDIHQVNDRIQHQSMDRRIGMLEKFKEECLRGMIGRHE